MGEAVPDHLREEVTAGVILRLDGAAMTTWEVIRWWELRRLLYNLILFAIGIASVTAMDRFTEGADPSGQGGMQAFGIAIGVVLYGILANILYTSGWVVELVGRKTDQARARSLAKKHFLLGMWLSCLLTTAPLWFGLVFWLSNRSS